MPVLKSVVIYYPKLNTPALEYQKQAVEDKPFMNKEYVVDALILPEEYKALKKQYKAVKAVREATVLDADEFKEKYQMEAPEGYENGDGEYTVVKFRKKAYYKDGNEGFAPEVMGCTRTGKTLDGVVINSEVGIGSGTVCNIQYKERTWDNQFGKGLALDLSRVAIRHLVEYVADDKIEDDMFEDCDDDMEDGMTEDPTTSTTPAKTDDKKSDDDW